MILAALALVIAPPSCLNPSYDDVVEQSCLPVYEFYDTRTPTPPKKFDEESWTKIWRYRANGWA